jgi:tetratricopeptide (TPR) repeat protein
MIKMASMPMRIPDYFRVFTKTFLVLLPAVSALMAAPAQADNTPLWQRLDFSEIRRGIDLRDQSGLLRASRSAQPADCLQGVAAFRASEPRRTAPWQAFKVEAACAMQASDFSGALSAAEQGLKLRGSDSDLLTLRAAALLALRSRGPEARSPEEAVQGREEITRSLTEALVFDRFEGTPRRVVLVLLIDHLRGSSEFARAAALLERWQKREPATAGKLATLYVELGDRPKALEFTEKLIRQAKAERAQVNDDVLSARAAALLLANDRVLNRNDFAEALSVLDQRRGAPDLEEIKLRATALLKLNRPADAIKVAGSYPELSELREQAKLEAGVPN